MAGHNSINLEKLLHLVAHNQDDETIQVVQGEYETYNKLAQRNLRTRTVFENELKSGLENVLKSLLSLVPMSFRNRNECAEGLKKAYERVKKEGTPLDRLRGAIGLVGFMLELLDIAERQGRTSSPINLQWAQELLDDAAVQNWFKEVYAPPSQIPATLKNSSTENQEEMNLQQAKDYWETLWEDLDPNKPRKLTLYRVGTTSFILRHKVNILARKEVALKCLLFPYTEIPDIKEATRSYAVRYGGDKIPTVIIGALSSTDKWILMDFIIGDTLKEFLEKRRAEEVRNKTPLLLRTDLLSSVGKPLLEALNELSPANSTVFKHEDLTPSNIIICTKPDKTIEKIVFIDLGRNYLYTHRLGLEANREALFVAPEVKNEEKNTDNADLYSFGMILIELTDPPGVQGSMIPDSLYRFAPQLARFIEDLTDKESKNRLLIFPLKDREGLYSIFTDLLKVPLSEREVTRTKFFWVQQFKALFFPRDRLTHAWELWRLMHPGFRWQKFWHLLRPSSTQTEIARHTGYLYGWLVVSTVGSWLIFLVSIVWGSRDFGVNPFVPSYISIPQTLLPGCGGTCVPFIDALQAPGYHFGPGNFPARLVGFTAGLALTAYYQNIFAGLTTKPISGWLARATEFSLRGILVCNPVLILIGDLHQPEWWLWLVVAGYPTIAVTILLCNLLATRTFHQAKKEQYNVPSSDDLSLKNFGQWGMTLIVAVVVVIVVGLGLNTNFLHDTWAYAFIGSALTVFLGCISKGIILAPGIRGSLCRAFTLGERLEAVAQSLPTRYHLSIDRKGNAMQAIRALHQGTFKGATIGGVTVTANQVYVYREIDQLLTLAQYLAVHDSTNGDSKLSDANVRSYLANALETYLQTTIPNYHLGNKSIGTPTPHN